MLASRVMRVCDVVIALTLILILMPLLLAIAIAIKVEDGGPVFFLQTRIGKDLKSFTVLKFRSMTAPPLDQGARQPDAPPSPREAMSTKVGDRRVTRVGRVLRPAHFDELPQLFNIVAGQMALVGVRPDTPLQETDYVPEYWKIRHRYRPGLTGPAQVGPPGQDLPQRTALERIWLENFSFILYLKIILLTILKVFARNSH